MWSKPEEIGRAFVQFFHKLFESEGVVGIYEYFASVTSQVSLDLDTMLAADFSPEEVDSTLAQMHPLKSPGPDGFNASFFQHHWGSIGNQVRMAVLDFLNGEWLPSIINETYIALIPNVANAPTVSDYRPISLCNILYKIIAKAIANRLKKVLPSIISHHQSAFVPGHLITDNVLIAYEALRTTMKLCIQRTHECRGGRGSWQLR
jgi:hypothetical protein